MNLNDYKARLSLWWAKKTIKDGRDFNVSMDDVGMLITLTSGEFRDVSFRYSPLKIVDDQGLVDFRTYVVRNPHNADIASNKFMKLTINIMRILLEEAIPETMTQSKEIEKQVMNENGNTDTSEPIQERAIHEESSPLLEKRVSARKPRKKAVRPDQPVHSEVQQPAKPKRNRARTSGKKRPNGE